MVLEIAMLQGIFNEQQISDQSLSQVVVVMIHLLQSSRPQEAISEQ